MARHGGSRLPAARAIEILLNPRVIEGKEFGDCADCDDPPVGEHRNAVTNGIKRVEVVCNQKNR